MPAHGAGLALATRPRGDHEVELAAQDRADEPLHEIAAIGAVAVHEDHDAALRRGRGAAGGASPAVAAFLRHEHARARGLRHGGRAVAAAAIDHDDLAHEATRDLRHDGRDRVRLVQHRNDDGDR
jgi:hypothetical protein